MEALRNRLGRLAEDHEVFRVRMRCHADWMDGLREPDRHYLDALAGARIEFHTLLHTHLAEEDAFVTHAFQLIRPGDGIATARFFGFGIKGLMDQYDRHIAHWTPERVAADWPRYREAVMSLQRQLAERMAWEEREVYPHFA